jgi:hypothetical protein
MKIRSNHITRDDIRNAAQTVPGVLHEVRDTFQPRKFHFGYDVVLFSSRLTGPASAGMPGWKACTWTEFGIFIDQLYAIDADAQIAGYQNHEDFISQTAYAVAHTLRSGRVDSMECPWLTEEQLADGWDRLETGEEARLYAARVQ